MQRVQNSKDGSVLMSELAAKVQVLRRQSTDEVMKARGLTPNGRTRAVLAPLLYRPATRFSEIAADFDRRVSEEGLVEAARWALGALWAKVVVSLREAVPQEGPLLIAANHPGTVDGLAIAATVGRPDLKIVASGLPFLRSLPRTAQHLIYATRDPHQRMGVVRAMVRQLKQGGAVLVFPSGKVDPDPAVLPGAEEALNTWSPSAGLVLRAVPETKVVVGVVSGVLSERHLQHPIVRLGREIRQKQLLAEMLQVIRQMLTQTGEMLTARLSLDVPVAASQLMRHNLGAADLTQALVQRARALLREHLAALHGAMPQA